MVEETVPARGHRLLGHTADMALEAWAPTRTECLAEAVGGLVDSFIDLSTATASENFAATFGPGDDESLFVQLLDEVIYLLDVFGRIPIDAEVEDARDGGLVVHFATATADEVVVTGAAPKAVSLHGLHFGFEAGRWRCQATIDV